MHAAARAHRASGGRVIGYLGYDAPEELIMAGGFMAQRLRVQRGEPAGAALPYLPPEADPLARSIVAQVRQGMLDHVDCLVFTSQPDVLKRTYLVLHELARLGELKTPELHLLNVVHSPHFASQRFTHNSMLAFRTVLEEWSGRPITDRDIRDQIEICNANRAVLARLNALRAAAELPITGADALLLLVTARTMEKAAHTRASESLLNAIEPGVDQNAVRAAVFGADIDSVALYRAIEACGCVIVGEAHAWAADPVLEAVDYRSDPVDALADYYFARAPQPASATVEARARFTRDVAEQVQAAVAINWLLKSDVAGHWDAPAQRRILGQANVPCLMIGDQTLHDAPGVAALDSVKRFLSEAKARALTETGS